ncbi:Transcription initiation factor TFIID subunit 12 [Datura stramonium]|uniref:Transcription initiation factor TFIID subunit 12 n=1 Tax=Datura stramonium TaxID=4076 RepID=A0ABS8SUI7_DATST|nr:Transcription initiation factor TFIID subunit 12 [Datura stramonium]
MAEIPSSSPKSIQASNPIIDPANQQSAAGVASSTTSSNPGITMTSPSNNNTISQSPSIDLPQIPLTQSQQQQQQIQMQPQQMQQQQQLAQSQQQQQQQMQLQQQNNSTSLNGIQFAISIFEFAKAEGRSNAGESVPYREFPWPVLAGYTGNGNDGISQHELSVKGKWGSGICTKGESKSVEAAVVPAKSSHHYSVVQRSERRTHSSHMDVLGRGKKFHGVVTAE